MKKRFSVRPIKVVAMMSLLMAIMHSHADEKSVIKQYKKTCVVCHATGAAGAPKTGVPDQWASRMSKGMDALAISVEKGMGAMPPKGLCFDCTMDDYKALIEYMAAGK